MSRSCSLRSDALVDFELLPQAVERLQVRRGLFREPPHVLALGLAQLLLEVRQAALGLLHLRRQELRRVLRPHLARAGGHVHEDLGQPVGDPLRRLGRAVGVGDDEHVEARAVLRRGDRLGKRDRLDAPAQALHRRLEIRLHDVEVLVLGDAREDLRREELLRDGADALLAVERRGRAGEVRRDGGRGHAERRARQVFLREEQREGDAGGEREHQRHDQPPLAAAENRDVVERVEALFVHQ